MERGKGCNTDYTKCSQGKAESDHRVFLATVQTVVCLGSAGHCLQHYCTLIGNAEVRRVKK